MNLSLRQATPFDVPFLWAMLAEAIHLASGEERPAPETLQTGPLAHYVADWGRPGDLALIAEVDGRPVGAAWYRLFPAHDPGYGFVSESTPELSLAVLAACRGQGIGSRLMAALIDQARVAGFPGLSLSVDPRNPALRLYQRLGFQFVTQDDGGSWTMLLPLV